MGCLFSIVLFLSSGGLRRRFSLVSLPPADRISAISVQKPSCSAAMSTAKGNSRISPEQAYSSCSAAKPGMISICSTRKEKIRSKAATVE